MTKIVNGCVCPPLLQSHLYLLQHKDILVGPNSAQHPSTKQQEPLLLGLTDWGLRSTFPFIS